MLILNSESTTMICLELWPSHMAQYLIHDITILFPKANARLLLHRFASLHVLFKLPYFPLTFCTVVFLKPSLSEKASPFTLLIQSASLPANARGFPPSISG